MSTPKYTINDRTMIDELRRFQPLVKKELDSLKAQFPNLSIGNLKHPLDDEIIGENGLLNKLSAEGNTIAYSNADQLDDIWSKLLEKAIVCLRYFDQREPFLENSQKTIVAYGLDKLTDYHRRYTDFESLMYGASAYYRDHVFHAVRVWFLGIFCLINPMHKDGQQNSPFFSSLSLDGGSQSLNDINFFEKISMWTIIALCHDLGYPLEKAEQIMDKTRRMMKEFIPNPNIWNNFGYSGVQDNINEYILKFISTKMKKRSPSEGDGDSNENFFGRIQPKYYLKYAKSLEHFQHGIISAVIIYKMLLYFLESDFNLNDDYIYGKEDARQFYIRREILRAIASHTCPDAYNIHITTFSSLLFLCDELQEWGRKSWNELYTGLSDSSITLGMDYFEPEGIKVNEDINMENVKDIQVIIDNIVRIFKRQYSLYKTTFRDGQYTSKRDFDLSKTMQFTLKKDGAATRSITVNFHLPSAGEAYFMVDISTLTKDEQTQIKDSITKQIEQLLYGSDLQIKDAIK